MLNYYLDGSVSSDDELFCVEAIVYGDDSKDANGHTISFGRFYGSGKANGRHDSFHAIDLPNFDIAPHGNGSVTLRTRRVCRSHERIPCFVFHLPANDMTVELREEALRNELRLFCMSNPGIAVIIKTTGARGPHPKLRKHMLHQYGPILMHGDEFECARASIVNVMQRIFDTKRARDALGKVRELDIVGP